MGDKEGGKQKKHDIKTSTVTSKNGQLFEGLAEVPEAYLCKCWNKQLWWIGVACKASCIFLNSKDYCRGKILQIPGLEFHGKVQKVKDLNREHFDAL